LIEAGKPQEEETVPVVKEIQIDSNIEINEIESLNDISLDSEKMSNKKIDLNQFRCNPLEQSESIPVQEEEEYIDLQNFLKSTTDPKKMEMNSKNSIQNTKQLLNDIDKLISKSEDHLPKMDKKKNSLNLDKFDEITNKYNKNNSNDFEFLENDLNRPEESNESIYGIRTNINAVIEYCHLLIKYLLENYSEYLAQKFTFIRLCKESKNWLGFELNYLNLQKFDSGKSKNSELFSIDNIPESTTKLKTSAQNNLNEDLKTPNNTPENYGKDPNLKANTIQQITKIGQNDEKLCWLRKADKKMILTEQTYLALENQILSTYENMNINESLFSMQKIYHRCVFDSFNEIMTAFIRQDRIFKLNERDRNIMKLSVFCQDDVEYILAKSQCILIDYVHQQCGILRDKEDSLLDSFLRNYDLLK
jgi:hypothetical protein